ncbi:MAG: hypothetical protein AB4057_21895 [Crocosphaera sp.]
MRIQESPVTAQLNGESVNPWTFAVRWNPGKLLGYSTDNQLGYPHLDLYITNRVGFSSWQQLRVRNQNRTAVGVGLRFPF